jgi:thioesterase domain-containing protein
MFWGYANLARHLGPDQPVHAFRSRGLGGEPEWDTIEEMAASHVVDLRARRPHGPYLLGGYCFGGVVAYEMARQLRAQGAEVPLLALFNCAPPNSGYERPGPWTSPRWQARFLGNLLHWAGRFAFHWTPRERWEFLCWKLRLLRRSDRSPPGADPGDLAVGDVDELVNLADYSEDQRAVWRTHVRALLRYHPGPYDGAVTLFRTRGHPLLCSFDPHCGWDGLARGGVRLHRMPGDHGNLLAEPHVGRVAAVLRDCLAAAGAAGEGTA